MNRNVESQSKLRFERKNLRWQFCVHKTNQFHGYVLRVRSRRGAVTFIGVRTPPPSSVCLQFSDERRPRPAPDRVRAGKTHAPVNSKCKVNSGRATASAASDSSHRQRCRHRRRHELGHRALGESDSSTASASASKRVLWSRDATRARRIRPGCTTLRLSRMHFYRSAPLRT